MITRLILISAFNLLALFSYSQNQIKVENKVLIELPASAVNYLDTASANLLAKNFGVSASATRKSFSKHSYKSGNVIYQFFVSQKNSDQMKHRSVTEKDTRNKTVREKRLINGNTFLIDAVEGKKNNYCKFYCFNDKTKSALRGVVTFPISEKPAAEREIAKVFESVKILD